MLDNDPLILILSRNMYYRRLYHLMLGAVALSFLSVLFLGVVIFYLMRNPVHPLYFATDNVSRLIQVVPVGKPNMAIDDIIAWAQDAVEESFTYDYINYPGQIQSAQKYFTTYGWKKYMEALVKSNNIVALKERKMIVTAQVVKKPVLLKEGVLSGAYAWQFEIPVLVTYLLPPYDGSQKFSNAEKVSMIVQRQPALQGYKGLGIVQLVATIESSSSSQVKQISDLPSR